MNVNRLHWVRGGRDWVLVAAESIVVSRSLIAVSPEVASLSAHSDGWTPLAIPDTPHAKP